LKYLGLEKYCGLRNIADLEKTGGRAGIIRPQSAMIYQTKSITKVDEK